jgi:hypothetical protein
MDAIGGLTSCADTLEEAAESDGGAACPLGAIGSLSDGGQRPFVSCEWMVDVDGERVGGGGGLG